MMKSLLIILTILFLVVRLQAAIINVPADQPDIQAGIDAAANGDTVLVADGTYFENINYKGKLITVASHYIMDGDTSHINNTIIDGSQPSNPDSASVVFFISGEDTTSVLKGFTITGGTGTSMRLFPHWWPYVGGGGILIVSSGAKIEHNKIINNSLTVTTSSDSAASGSAIIAFGDVGDFLVIRDNLISDNTATSVFRALGTVNWGMKEKTIFERNVVTANVCTAPRVYGGGLLIFGQEGWRGLYLVRNNIIKDNILNGSTDGSGGGILIDNCAPEIYNNIISGNQAPAGGGIAANQWDNTIAIQKPLLINNTIVNNSAVISGGGILIFGSQQPAVKALNNIVWGNSAPISPQISVATGSIEIHYSDVEGGWSGEGNVAQDPLLAADSLTNASPCIGAGILEYDFGTGMVAHSVGYDINGRMRPYPAPSAPDLGAWESKLDVSVSIEAQPFAGIPGSYVLNQNYPNPFNPSTTIEFTVAKAGFATLQIYNVSGANVATLVAESLNAGSYKYHWDARGLASGVYFYRLEAGNFTQTRKLLLLR